MLRSSLCNYSDPYTLVSETITIPGAGADNAATWLNERNKGVLFKNWAPFTDWINEIILKYIMQKYIDVVMPTYNLIEYRKNYSKS